MDVLACEAATRKAVEAIRSGGGPQFIEFKTYRFRAHSMFDAELYREKAEVEVWKDRDPIPRFVARLKAEGIIDDEAIAGLEAEVESEIEAAVQFAEASPWEDIAELERFVYSEGGTA
jgi:TPP-dependent pyruvate/acetoin dehydrogenase alpha subunit